MTELVSIVMPCFNSVATIQESIQSVLNQTYTNWELLITDDCSRDDSVKVIRKLASHEPRIKLFELAINGGAGVARNYSLTQATGRYIAFLDADDLWMPYKLERQVSFMAESRIALSYSYYQKFTSAGIGGTVFAPSRVTYQQLLYSNVMGCLTVMYDRFLVGDRQFPLIRKRQDMGLWLEILKDVGEAYCLTEVLAMYRADTGMTANKFSVLKYQWQFYRQVVQLGFFRSVLTFCIYAYRGFVKSRV